MRLPVIRGVIDRRILVNYRLDPALLQALLPAPFRAQIVRGFGIAGICLIRLRSIRPRFLPALFGIRSENAAHRIAVEWDDAGQTRTGVYVPRRDTSSLLNCLAGGRLFPGVHHRADFRVEETEDRFRCQMDSRDGEAHVLVDGSTAAEIPDDSVFDSVTEVSEFFERGSLGYSPNRKANCYDGLELRSFNWKVEPLCVDRVESSFFEDRVQFPDGSVAFDSALLMRNIDHEWHGRDDLPCPANQAANA